MDFAAVLASQVHATGAEPDRTTHAAMQRSRKRQDVETWRLAGLFGNN